ncbi:DNA replication/repair protein RecF [Flexistipes sp.]|uniref:DNA replication/repair protein RecF n=1 Tax=Flexistipes sp. TaxID=3088135 RepID=UPI002E1D04FC|nr:AAA family ATPase [Flexistipes sp.]
MLIQNLFLLNFRNHKELNLSFSKNINYIKGANAAGKTSIVEGISTALNLKSFRQSQLKHLVNFNSDNFFIETNVMRNFYDYDEYLYNIKFKYSNGSFVYENNKKIKRVEDYIFNYPVLVYSPENEGLISENQEKKRKFLDKISFYTNKVHFNNLKNYNKLLRIKKSYLYHNHPDHRYLESITESMYNFSADIQKSRKYVVNQINDKILEFYNNVPGKIENFYFIYEPAPVDIEKINEEKAKKRVLSGAHLDRIYVFYNGKKYESFASFGQKKTFALCSLFTSVLIVEEFLNSGIIIILDDLEVGLDSSRINFFKGLLGKNQTFITGVSNRYFKDAKNIAL